MDILRVDVKKPFLWFVSYESHSFVIHHILLNTVNAWYSNTLGQHQKTMGVQIDILWCSGNRTKTKLWIQKLSHQIYRA